MSGPTVKLNFTLEEFRLAAKVLGVSGNPAAALERVLRDGVTMYRACRDIGVAQSQVHRLSRRIAAAIMRMKS